MGLVLDAGALIGFDRGNRQVAALVEAARRRGEQVRTSSGCVAQAWRGGGSRQVLLARLLEGLLELPLDRRASRATGALCQASGTADVVDRHLALLAQDGDLVLTSDPGDLGHLLEARGVQAVALRC